MNKPKVKPIKQFKHQIETLETIKKNKGKVFFVYGKCSLVDLNALTGKGITIIFK